MSLKKVLQARAWICVGVVPLVMGCSPHKELTSEDSVQQEVRDYEEAIKEIQQDASLTEKQKETAIKPFQLRVGRDDNKGALMSQEVLLLPSNDGRETSCQL